MNFSVTIPTYNREKDLEDCIKSILDQTASPHEILVIDDGELSEKFLQKIKEASKNKLIDFVYYKKNHKHKRRGLSESKNKALKLAKSDIIFILDDDVVLCEDNFFEKIIDIWRQNTDRNLVGVGGAIKNDRKKNKLEEKYNYIFGLTGDYAWDVNDVGFQVWDSGVKETTKGYYAHGGVCSYNKKLAQELGFTTFGGGRTALEDVDFSLRAKNKGYYFLFEPNAKVIHNQSPVAREKQNLCGFKEGHNRKIIFKNNCKKNIKNYLWFFWANVGWILRQFLVGNYAKGLGMIKGLIIK